MTPLKQRKREKKNSPHILLMHLGESLSLFSKGWTCSRKNVKAKAKNNGFIDKKKRTCVLGLQKRTCVLGPQKRTCVLGLQKRTCY